MSLSYNSNSDELTMQDDAPQVSKGKSPRNLIGFWILGLCNNYAYVIMLTAAFDLLKDSHNSPSDGEKPQVQKNETFCNEVSTGAVLLANILPALLIKIVAPFIVLGTNPRVVIVVILSAMSLILTSTSVAHWMTFLGVICAALSSGLGEVTFLQFSSYFHKDVVSTWSSGTGGAGVVGATTYTALTHLLSVRNTLLVMLFFPLLMAVTFWVLMEHPPESRLSCRLGCGSEFDPMLEDSVTRNEVRSQRNRYTLQQKISLIKPLLKYMVPLGIVYFAEYFINQGLMELLYFPKASLEHTEQYRWYQVDYQVGVFVSRSSVNFFQVKKLWILPILQLINMIFLIFAAYYEFIPNIWIVLVIIFYEGLLGGCAYVNTFYAISQEVSEEHREFSLGVTSIGDATGITLAGAVAMPVHDALCKLHS